MIKISKLADYAVVVLAALHRQDGALHTACALSSATKLPEPTVAKVLKLMSKGNIVTSVRGANGGYSLAKPVEELTIAQVIVAVDGPVSIAACVEGAMVSCEYKDSCPVSGRWDGVNKAIQDALSDVSLSDMINERISA